MLKTFVMTGMIVGSVAGGYLPAIWGGDIFSMASIWMSALGAFAGIWVGYKIGMRLGV